MSYPVINRWGLNLFWTKFWYNDKVNLPLNHQGLIFEKIIIIYLNYGLYALKNFVVQKYWYRQTRITNFNFFKETLKYFRNISYKNKALNDYSSYRMRVKVKSLFFSKIWFIISQKWMIINVFAFTPLRKKKTIKLKKNYGLFSIKTNNSIYKFYKLKILFSLLLSKEFTNKNFYNF